MPDDKQLEITRDEDFAALYANNTQFESTLWDLKIIFGQVDLTNNAIEQHTSVSLAWPQAKIAAYFLLVNMVIQQANNGAINIPLKIIPQRPDPNEPGLDKNGKRTVTYLAWIHDQIFGSNPYVPLEVAKLDNLSEGTEPKP